MSTLAEKKSNAIRIALLILTVFVASGILLLGYDQINGQILMDVDCGDPGWVRGKLERRCSGEDSLRILKDVERSLPKADYCKILRSVCIEVGSDNIDRTAVHRK